MSDELDIDFEEVEWFCIICGEPSDKGTDICENCSRMTDIWLAKE